MPKTKKSKPKSPPAGTKKSKNAMNRAWEIARVKKMTGKKKPSKSPAKRKTK
jgi:hypothetical protein